LGPVFTAGIFAEIQDIRRFPAHPQLAQFAGITWSRYESGNFKAVSCIDTHKSVKPQPIRCCEFCGAAFAPCATRQNWTAQTEHGEGHHAHTYNRSTTYQPHIRLQRF
jgi:hypothetical protein